MRNATGRAYETDLRGHTTFKGSAQILKLPAESQKITPSEIAAKVGINHVVTRAHLEALENGSILACANFGKRIRYYRFKESAEVIPSEIL